MWRRDALQHVCTRTCERRPRAPQPARSTASSGRAGPHSDSRTCCRKYSYPP
jgi:hypothetical protein